MSQIKAAITTVASHLPEYVLTNKELETMVDTTDEWITTRTGIKERRILKGEGKGVTEMAKVAVEKLLEKRGIGPEEIDLVIFCSVTPDKIFPASANIVSAKVGMSNAFGYDLNAACSGFIYGLVTGSKFIESGSHKKVIVIGADKMSAIIDYTDRRRDGYSRFNTTQRWQRRAIFTSSCWRLRVPANRRYSCQKTTLCAPRR